TLEDWETLDEKEYSIQYPDTFELDVSGEMGASFIIRFKTISDDDSFEENINLVIQDLKGAKVDLDMFVEISEQQVRTVLTDGTIIESSRRSANQRTYHKLIYTGTYNNLDIKWLQYFWI